MHFRLFERDALELSSQFELWGEQLQHGEVPQAMKETEVQLRNLADHITHIQTATYEVAQRGEELVQHFENSGINIMADTQYNGVTRVQVIFHIVIICPRAKNKCFFSIVGLELNDFLPLVLS